MTKLWCSKGCEEQDWELGHKENCTKEADQRKVKAGMVERREAGVQLQELMFAETSGKETAKNQAFLNEVKAACMQ